MKAKLSRGAGFKGILAYTTKKVTAELVGGSMPGGNAHDLLVEFAALRHVRPDVERPVWHASLALPEGENLHRAQWQAIAADFMEGMGFDVRHAWTAWRHGDTSHDHIHIIASRIGSDGSLWLGQHDVRAALKLTSELEHRHGIQITPAYNKGASSTLHAPSKSEMELGLRTGEQPPRMQLAAAIEAAIQDKPTLSQMIDRLESGGVRVKLNTASTGRISGISFELGGIAFKGSQLGKVYAFPQISQRIDYDKDRDGKKLAEPSTCRRRDDATARSNTDTLRADNRRSSTELEPANRSSSNTGGAFGSASRRSDCGPQRLGIALEEDTRKRTAGISAGKRRVQRVSGTGAVASARIAANKAEIMEIWRSGVPVRGAGSRFAAAVARDPATDRLGYTDHRKEYLRRSDRLPAAAATTAATIIPVKRQPYDRDRGR